MLPFGDPGLGLGLKAWELGFGVAQGFGVCTGFGAYPSQNRYGILDQLLEGSV